MRGGNGSTALSNCAQPDQRASLANNEDRGLTNPFIVKPNRLALTATGEHRMPPSFDSSILFQEGAVPQNAACKAPYATAFQLEPGCDAGDRTSLFRQLLGSCPGRACLVVRATTSRFRKDIGHRRDAVAAGSTMDASVPARKLVTGGKDGNVTERCTEECQVNNVSADSAIVYDSCQIVPYQKKKRTKSTSRYRQRRISSLCNPAYSRCCFQFSNLSPHFCFGGPPRQSCQTLWGTARNNQTPDANQ